MFLGIDRPSDSCIIREQSINKQLRAFFRLHSELELGVSRSLGSSSHTLVARMSAQGHMPSLEMEMPLPRCCGNYWMFRLVTSIDV